MQVPFADLGRPVHAECADLGRTIRRVLDSGNYILGPEVNAFEREFGSWLGSLGVAGVASGTDAIELCLRACGVQPGDEVVTQANTCIPTVAAITRLGAHPVLCDVERSSGRMDPSSAADAIGPRTRAIVPVHLYGQCADLAELTKVAAGRGLTLVEDCAQALGAVFGGRPAGGWGQASAYSFYPTKNLGALGDGGAVASRTAPIIDRVRRLRVYGQTDRYVHGEPGINSRLDELQAGILRLRLQRLDAGNERRRSIATYYDEATQDSHVQPLLSGSRSDHANHLYVVRARDRERLQSDLSSLGVSTLIHYPRAIHQQPSHAHLADAPVSLKNSELLASQVLSLPLYPELTDAEVEHVAAAIKRAASRQPQ